MFLALRSETTYQGTRVTEFEWLTAIDPRMMLEHVTSDRTLRLFACACCRAGAAAMPRPLAMVLIGAIERFADDGCSVTDLASARTSYHHDLYAGYYTEAWWPWYASNLDALRGVEDILCARLFQAEHAALLREIVGNPWRPATWLKVGDVVTGEPGHPLACGSGGYSHAVVVSLAPFALVSEAGDMLWTCTVRPNDVARTTNIKVNTAKAFARWERNREKIVCDPPDRPVWCTPLEKSWLTWNDSLVPRLARRIYQEKSFDELAILADALEEAGCQESRLLQHFRGKESCPYCLNAVRVGAACKNCAGVGWTDLRGPHVLGCWVLDSILEKS